MTEEARAPHGLIRPYRRRSLLRYSSAHTRASRAFPRAFRVCAADDVPRRAPTPASEPQLLMHYDADFGMEARIGRFHNIYGPCGTWKGGREKAPASFCRKATAHGSYAARSPHTLATIST